ncbi:MAG: thiol:disulfide interchange protein DsbD [Salibacteraceae bacterium]|jgi:thiol:disulfide interchange protein DsbD
MIRFLFGAILAFSTLTSTAQVFNPVSWSFDSKQLSDNEFELQFKAEIDPHWHIYSNTLSGDEGPLPTEFTFEKSKDFELVGGIQEPKPTKEFDKNFQMDLLFFDDEVTFSQKVRLKNPTANVKGELTFMVCDDSKCLPPDYIEFSFDLKKSKSMKMEIVSNDKQPGLIAENPSTKDSPGIEAVSLELKIPHFKAKPLLQENKIYDPVKWTFSAEDIGNGEYLIVASADVEEGWHMYSQNLEGADGPVPTEFRYFNENKEFEIIGTPEEEGDLIKEYDNNFMMNLNFYEKEVSFKQKIKVKEGVNQVKGDVYYMVCDESKCLPPETIEFNVNLNDFNTADSLTELESNHEKKTSSRSFWGIFLLSFLSGFAALLTPCVFPMIPMTVSYFTKQSKTKAEGIRNAVIYGISIIVIYVLLGTVVTAVFGSEVLSEMATNFWFNIIFFILLVVFAISFLGAFEITLPSSWVNAADKGADKGGLVGIFFMAFTLALVSFSCTGPIVGTLIVEAASIGGLMPIVGMFGFSLAIALPFALFAAFPGWLNSLPQSGGWLNSVKVVLGFLELGLAMKFLSNADLVIDAGWVTREVFLAFWIVISAMLGFYLIGKIRLPHDSPMEKIPVGRILMAVITFTFTIYLIPGMWGAPLKLIAGFPPPMTYAEAPFGSFAKGGGQASVNSHIEGTHQGPQNIPVFYDWDEGLKYAQLVNKPLFVDFTGKACANCRKMEDQVWGEPGIIDMLRNDVVIVSLYVDFEEPLPASEVKEVMIGTRKKTIKSVGDKWMYKQVERYKTNTQPYYTMLGSDGKDLANGSADYDRHRDPEDFKAWLSKGLKLYKVAD